MFLITIIIILFVILFVMYLYQNNYLNYLEQFTSDNMLFTDYAYKNKLNGMVCSKWLDYMPKHVQINSTGNINYPMSRTPPNKFNPNCRIIDCPPLVTDDITPFYPEQMDHLRPLKWVNQKNLTCWSC
jgi:hypothetical protein